MKDGKVTVVADKAGNVVRKSANNPKYGNIRVTQRRFMTDDNGFLRPKTVSALMPGEVEHLLELGVKDGDEIDGRIITKHSMEPFNPSDPERDLKIAGDSEVICTVEDEPIYMKSFFSFDANKQDGEYIQHDNKEEIQAAHAAKKGNGKSKAIAPNEEFKI